MLTGQYSKDLTLVEFFTFFGDSWCGIGFAGAIFTYDIRALGSTLGPWVHYARCTIVSQLVYSMLYELMAWVACCAFKLPSLHLSPFIHFTMTSFINQKTLIMHTLIYSLNILYTLKYLMSYSHALALIVS